MQDQWHEVQPVELVRQTAQLLLRVYHLRAADALQLASAGVVCDHRAQKWGFVCLDDRLSAAAERGGSQLRPGREKCGQKSWTRSIHMPGQRGQYDPKIVDTVRAIILKHVSTTPIYLLRSRVTGEAKVESNRENTFDAQEPDVLAL